MKSVLITGGSGYFGSLLLRKLHERGHECAVLDINDAADRPHDVEFIRADIRDPEAVFRAMEGRDTVFHNVAQVPLAKDKVLFDSVNRIGTENMLSGALRAGAAKVIYTSSSAVFGVPEKNPVTEDMEPRPQEAYGLAKHRGELICRAYAGKGLDVTVIRPRTILGHGRLGIFQILFEWVRTGYNVPVLGRGDNVYQFVHADDLAEACILASQRSGPATYNCGSDRYGTMRDALEALCRHANTGSCVRSIPMLPAVAAMKVTSALGLSPLGTYHALMYGRSMYFDVTRAQTELGWRPRFSNEEMFCESYDWYFANRERVIRSCGGEASHHRSALKQGALGLIKHLL
jgi:nucleoside-diphosphate-sugar epimerase